MKIAEYNGLLEGLVGFARAGTLGPGHPRRDRPDDLEPAGTVD